MAETIQQIFDSFQDYLSSEQDLREVTFSSFAFFIYVLFCRVMLTALFYHIRFSSLI